MVTLGGGLGSALRYVVTDLVNRRNPPWGTMTVNLMGSLAIGILVGWYSARGQDSLIRLGVGVGFLGGFTTFSSWMAESVGLLETSDLGKAAFNLGVSMVVGLAAAIAGLAIGRHLTAF